MEKILPFFVVLLISSSAIAYEVLYRSPEQSRKAIHISATNTVSKIPDDYEPPKPVLIDKPIISYECQAHLTAMKIVKDKSGKASTLFMDDEISTVKSLGRLKPDEDSFKNMNRGSLNFSFKIKDKVKNTMKNLDFDLKIIGPELTDNQSFSSSLRFELGFVTKYWSSGKKRSPASKEINDIEFDANKSLPGGFTMRMPLIDDIVSGYSLSLKVNCSDPKKELQPIEVFIF